MSGPLGLAWLQVQSRYTSVDHKIGICVVLWGLPELSLDRAALLWAVY